MQVAISDITSKMRQALRAKKLKKSEIDFIIEMYLGGELRGHTTHGLASFPGFVKNFRTDLPPIEVIKRTHSFVMIDAKSNSGPLVAKFAADEAIKRAKKEVTASVLIKNMDSWLRPGAIAQYIAEHELMAVVTNRGGGAVVLPPGGRDPVAGTNPISYGIPTADGPLVVDMATSKKAWAGVRVANKYGTALPEDTYYNADGEPTRDPQEAVAVEAFGEYKGFSLTLLVEIMCGSLVGMEMMVKNGSARTFGGKMSERGGMIFAIDPAQTVGLAEFKKANSAYLAKIRATRSRSKEGIRIPGERAGTRQAATLKVGFIELPEVLWNEIKAL